MLDDPRTKARSFLESSSIVSELEDVLNHLVYEKPDDLHGYLANHFLDLSKQPKIENLIFKRLIGPTGEPAMHIDLTIALRNRTERHNGITINLLSSKLNPVAVKQLEALIDSTTSETMLKHVELYDQSTIDEILMNFRSQRGNEMAKLAEIEATNAANEITSDVPTSKQPANKRTAASPGVPKAGGGAPPPSKKGPSKDVPSIEIIPDEPEPSSFAGQLLITGISLTCLLISAEMQRINLYRLIQLSSIKTLSMPLPIIPIIQSGIPYPGKQSLIKYFMIIPTSNMIRNEEWIHKVHSIIQFLRDSIATTKGATLQSSFSTDDGCLVFPMDKPEQGFDLLNNAVNAVCGAEEHCFDYAIQINPYEIFDYTRGRYEVMSGVIKSPDELVDVYTELIDAYPRCIMLIDPFRHADKPSLSRLCDRISNKCYITSTDVRRYQNDDDNNTINCHLLSLNQAPTISELIQRVHELNETNNIPLGLFEREHQDVAQVYLADLAVSLGFRFLKLPGILSLGGQTTSIILQRLSLIRDDIEMSDDLTFDWPKQHEFVHIRSPIDLIEQERVPSATPANAKNKDKKKSK